MESTEEATALNEVSEDMDTDLTDAEYVPDKEEDKELQTEESEVRYKRRSYSEAWKYFTVVDPETRLAKCKACSGVFRFTSTVSNLLKHTQRIHPELITGGGGLSHRNVEKEVLVRKEDEYIPKKSNCRLWRYFRKLEPYEEKKAQCKVCLKLLSYRTTISNLKCHMGNKHPKVVENDGYFIGRRYIKKLFSRCISSSNNERSSNRIENWDYFQLASDDENEDNQSESNEAVKLTSQIWAQFNHDDEEPTCNICRNLVPNRLEDMKNHLEEQHPDVLDQITATALDATSEGDIFVTDDNTYTEVVYLEEEEQNKTKESKRKQYPERDVFSFQENNKKQRVIPKRERNHSESTDEHVPRPKKEKANSPDELDVFMSYLKILLRKVPEENSPKLHLDIMNLVMNATRPAQKHFIVEKINVDFPASAQENSSVTNIQIQNDTNPSNGHTNIDSISNSQGTFLAVPVQKLAEDKMMPRLVTISANGDSEPRLITAGELQTIKRMIANGELNTKNNAQNAQQPDT